VHRPDAPIVVIINPLSGPGRRDAVARGRDRSALARRVLDETGRAGRIEVTSHGGHARAIARAAAAEGVSLVVAWGGDGTVHEIGGALAFGPTPLAIVPGGSGNGLARTLGVSMSPRRALHQALAGGAPRAIDVGEIAGHLFFNVAGIGFDAHVAALFNRPGNRRGFSRYLMTSMIELFRYQPCRYAIRTGGRDPLDRCALMVVLANGAQYGNGACVSPDARLDDGLLDLVVIESHSPWRDVLRTRHLFDGSIARRAGVLLTRVERVSISPQRTQNDPISPQSTQNDPISPQSTQNDPACPQRTLDDPACPQRTQNDPSADGAEGSGRRERSENVAGPLAFHADGESFQHDGPLEALVHREGLRVIAPRLG
jgi:diacylglycerol kinase (ATP)